MENHIRRPLNFLLFIAFFIIFIFIAIKAFGQNKSETFINKHLQKVAWIAGSNIVYNKYSSPILLFGKEYIKKVDGSILYKITNNTIYDKYGIIILTFENDYVCNAEGTYIWKWNNDTNTLNDVNGNWVMHCSLNDEKGTVLITYYLEKNNERE